MRVSTVIGFALATSGAHAASGFTNSCLIASHFYSFSRFTMTTLCKGSDGKFNGTSSLNIVACYFALDGKMGCGPGG